MPLRRPLPIVLLCIALTIAAQFVLGWISLNMPYAGARMNSSTQNALSLAIHGAGLAAVIALLGPRHQQLLPLALLFAVSTFFGTIIAGFYLAYY